MARAGFVELATGSVEADGWSLDGEGLECASMKWIVVLAFVLILGSLGSALVFLIRDRGRTRNVARALGFRVGFSVLLFLMILFAHAMGWIQSTGIPVRGG